MFCSISFLQFFIIETTGLSAVWSDRQMKPVIFYGKNSVVFLVEKHVCKSCSNASDDRADYRYPAVSPVAAAFALDRKQGVCKSRRKITGRVEGVTCGTAE